MMAYLLSNMVHIFRLQLYTFSAFVIYWSGLDGISSTASRFWSSKMSYYIFRFLAVIRKSVLFGALIVAPLVFFAIPPASVPLVVADVVVIIFGMFVVYAIILELHGKIVAKYRLGNVLRDNFYHKDNMAELVRFLESDGPRRWRVGGDEPPNPWYKLFLFLESDQFGQVAARALFQPSKVGRIKYLFQAFDLGPFPDHER
jgi:hypothetical protein